MAISFKAMHTTTQQEEFSCEGERTLVQYFGKEAASLEYAEGILEKKLFEALEEYDTIVEAGNAHASCQIVANPFPKGAKVIVYRGQNNVYAGSEDLSYSWSVVDTYAAGFGEVLITGWIDVDNALAFNELEGEILCHPSDVVVTNVSLGSDDACNMNYSRPSLDDAKFYGCPEVCGPVIPKLTEDQFNAIIEPLNVEAVSLEEARDAEVKYSSRWKALDAEVDRVDNIIDMYSIHIKQGE